MTQTPFHDKVIPLRGELVILDFELAQHFLVSTSDLNRAVKRNQKRFPSAFAFQLTKEEVASLKAVGSLPNIVFKYLPYAFTEQGCWTLSFFLRSQRAIDQGLALIRVFKKVKDELQAQKQISEPTQRLLDHTPAVNIFNISGPTNLMIGNHNQIKQKYETATEVLHALAAVLPNLSAQEAQYSQQLSELIQAVKDKNKPSVESKLKTINSALDLLKHLSPGLSLLKSTIQSVILSLPSLPL